MRHERAMAVLRFAERGCVSNIVGDWLYDENNRRGPSVKSVKEAMGEALVVLDPAGRLCLTESGRRRLEGVPSGVRIVTIVPVERMDEFRRLVNEFFAKG